MALAGGSDTGATAETSGPRTLTLGHNLGDTHPTSAVLEEFAELVAEGTDGRITVEMLSEIDVVWLNGA